MVALRKESVDRNEEYVRSFAAEDVALRKESVDRNAFSQSFRHFLCVALRKESVDRNIVPVVAVDNPICRSPQGERG